MEIKELEAKILELDIEIKRLLDECGYFDSENLEMLEYNKASPGECVIFNEFRRIFSHLEYVHFIVEYLQNPIRKSRILDDEIN